MNHKMKINDGRVADDDGLTCWIGLARERQSMNQH
jgi:hypothetical protein